MSGKSKNNFLNGAMILTAALLIVKVIGFFYKIPLFNLIGGDGWGYYNDAYQVYSLMFVISTGGIPVAIAKLISESNAVGRINEPKKILSLSLKCFALIGIIGMLILIFFAKLFAELIVKTPGSTMSIMAIAPAVFFVSLGSSFKGYFQGYKNMAPTAIYQVLEATAKLLGLLIVVVLIALGYTEPSILACGAVMGVTIGSFVSSVFMFIRFYFGKEQIDTSVKNPIANRSNSVLFKAMLKIAIPVTLSSSVMSITSLLDMVFVKNSLIASGLTAETANFVYGSYSGCCYSLFNLPPTITQTIGISVFPFISELFSLNKKKEAYKNMDSSMRIVSLIAAPCAIGMSFFAYPILSVIYFRPTEVNIATSPFHVLALGIYLVAMVYPTNLFLQATGKERIPLISMLIGAILKIVVNITLVSMPSVRINGAPFGTLLCYGSILIINLFMLYKTQKYKPNIMSVFIKPILASLLSVGISYIVYRFVLYGNVSSLICAVIGIGLSAILYVAFIFILKAINKDDVMLLPKGEKIADILSRKGLIK